MVSLGNWFVVLLTVGLATSRTAADLPSRPVRAHSVAGTDAHSLTYRSADGALHSFGDRILRFEDDTVLTPHGEAPLRVIQLRSGEQITAELQALNTDTVRLRLRGGAEIALPLHALGTMGALPGWRDVFYEDFEQMEMAFELRRGSFQRRRITNPADAAIDSALEPGGQDLSLRWSAADLITAGRVSFAFCEPEQPDAGQWSVTLGFAADGHETRIAFASDANTPTYRVAGEGIRLGVSLLRRQPGPRQVMIEFDASTLTVLVDNAVLAHGSRPAGQLQFLQIDAEGVPENARAWLDDFWLQSPITDRPPSAPTLTDSDAVALADGSIVFGTVQQANSRQVVLRGPSAVSQWSWTDVRKVQMRTRPTEAASTGNPGWHCDLKFRPWRGVPDLENDRLTVAVVAADGERLTVRHDVFGEIAIPLQQLLEVRPQFLGQRRFLLREPTHLGNDIRRDFRNPRPVGHTWTGTFSLSEVPAGKAFLRIVVADLEPSGPGTLPGSRHLQTLRTGKLVTTLEVNGHPMGTANKFVDRHGTVAQPREIHIPLPTNRLRVGQNTWTLRQQPLAPDSTEYDDCEVGPVFLDVVDDSLRESNPDPARGVSAPR